MLNPTVEPRFIADAMLGKLARWLRLLGYDTLYSQENDSLIAHRARSEGRIVLTRDRGLALRRGLQVILLTAPDLELQIAQVNAKVAIPPLTPRCSACNGTLSPISLQLARPHIPSYIAATHSDFSQCQQCGKIFWRGTHWDGIRRRIAAALDLDVTSEFNHE
ncbi:MAG: Mut7-C RNAse domain-containing protein [Anaerolineae bacterium]|nr:Mut7-C RNAse domain-containing protein [Anaerolineae bacterium]